MFVTIEVVPGNRETTINNVVPFKTLVDFEKCRTKSALPAKVSSNNSSDDRKQRLCREHASSMSDFDARPLQSSYARCLATCVFEICFVYSRLNFEYCIDGFCRNKSMALLIQEGRCVLFVEDNYIDLVARITKCI